MNETEKNQYNFLAMMGYVTRESLKSLLIDFQDNEQVTGLKVQTPLL